MPAFAAYRELVRVTGPGLLVVAFLARLSWVIGSLGSLTMMVAAGHRYALAGATAGAMAVGSALGGPFVGGLADRYGQRVVGLGCAVLNAAAFAALVAAALVPGPDPVILLAATAAGVSNPNVGPLVRVRWAALLPDQGRADLYRVALSYESVIEELNFVAGPVLLGVLAVTGYPGAPVVVAGALIAVFGVWFAAHRTALGPATRPVAGSVPGSVPGPAGRTGSRVRLPRRALVAVLAAMGCVGLVFGGTQTGTATLAATLDRPELTGPVYALMGVASAIAGLATAALPARFPPAARYLTFAVALLVGCGPLLLIDSLVGAAVAMVVVGVTIAPYLISVYELGGRIAPAGRHGLVMTLLASSGTVGFAAGAGVAGALAERFGPPGAFAVSVAAGVLAVTVALVNARSLGRAVSAAVSGAASAAG